MTNFTERILAFCNFLGGFEFPAYARMLFDQRIQERLEALSDREERLEATETRMEAIESDVSGALDSLDTRFDQIQNRLTQAETTTDSALKNLESTVSNLDDRIGDVAVLEPADRSPTERQGVPSEHQRALHQWPSLHYGRHT